MNGNDPCHHSARPTSGPWAHQRSDEDGYDIVARGLKYDPRATIVAHAPRAADARLIAHAPELYALACNIARLTPRDHWDPVGILLAVIADARELHQSVDGGGE